MIECSLNSLSHFHLVFVSVFFSLLYLLVFVPKENWQINRGKNGALNEFIIHFFGIDWSFAIFSFSFVYSALMRAQAKVVNQIKPNTTVITAIYLTEKNNK